MQERTRRRKQNPLRNEKGSVSIEFLGVLPYFFLFFLLLWQVVGSGYAVVKARAAVNEAGKVYAMTKDLSQAEQTARKMIGNSDNLRFQSLQLSGGANDFQLVLESSHGLVFIPTQWRPAASITFSQTAAGRVME